MGLVLPLLYNRFLHFYIFNLILFLFLMIKFYSKSVFIFLSYVLKLFIKRLIFYKLSVYWLRF